MEKMKPTYLLAAIKLTFTDADITIPATKTALGDAVSLGLDARQIIDCIQAIESKHFYKSMTTDRDSKVWQDVYYVPWGGQVLYVKFTQLADGRLFLVSFKER